MKAMEAATKVTGERVMTPEGGFNATWQRHVAAYGLAAAHLGPGRVLDLGCGVGHSYDLLAPRETVGVDISPEVLAGQDRETHPADMRDLPFPDGSFPSVLSVQSIEHVPDAAPVLAEVVRVLEPGAGATAIFVTPNRLTFGRPDEIIDPYHHVEYSSAELAALCGRHFDEVRSYGIFGSERYMELYREERERLEKLLAKDPLRLRRALPVRVKRWLYDSMLGRARKEVDPRAAAIEPGDFELRSDGLAESLDVVAVCRGPRRAVSAG
jgi:SAM-dependent methyltransferase